MAMYYAVEADGEILRAAQYSTDDMDLAAALDVAIPGSDETYASTMVTVEDISSVVRWVFLFCIYLPGPSVTEVSCSLVAVSLFLAKFYLGALYWCRLSHACSMVLDSPVPEGQGEDLANAYLTTLDDSGTFVMVVFIRRACLRVNRWKLLRLTESKLGKL